MMCAEMLLVFLHHFLIGGIDVKPWRDLKVLLLRQGGSCSTDAEVGPDRSVIKSCCREGVRGVAPVARNLYVCGKRCM